MVDQQKSGMESRTGVLHIHQIHLADFCRHTGWVGSAGPHTTIVRSFLRGTQGSAGFFFPTHILQPASHPFQVIPSSLSYCLRYFLPPIVRNGTAVSRPLSSSPSCLLTQNSTPQHRDYSDHSVGVRPSMKIWPAHKHTVSSDWYLGLVLFLFPARCGDKFAYSLK